VVAKYVVLYIIFLLYSRLCFCNAWPSYCSLSKLQEKGIKEQFLRTRVKKKMHYRTPEVTGHPAVCSHRQTVGGGKLATPTSSAVHPGVDSAILRGWRWQKHRGRANLQPGAGRGWRACLDEWQAAAGSESSPVRSIVLASLSPGSRSWNWAGPLWRIGPLFFSTGRHSSRVSFLK
jgi:hypothetical protein